MRIIGKKYMCPNCGWEHVEVDITCSMGPMLDAFSDPEGLKKIMKEHSRERVKEALAKHDLECPKGRNLTTEMGAMQ